MIRADRVDADEDDGRPRKRPPPGASAAAPGPERNGGDERRRAQPTVYFMASSNCLTSVASGAFGLSETNFWKSAFASAGLFPATRERPR